MAQANNFNEGEHSRDRDGQFAHKPHGRPSGPLTLNQSYTEAELATEYETTTEDVDTIIDQLIGLGAVTPDDTGTLPPADWAEVREALDNSRAVLGHTETRDCYVCGTTWTGRVAPDAYQPLPVDTDPETGKLTCADCATP